MTYSEKKQELTLLSNLVIKEYNDLLPKVLLLCKELGSVPKSKLSFKEQCDYASFIANQDDMLKVTSLIKAFLYIENPRNRKVVNALKEDIYYNKKRRREVRN